MVRTGGRASVAPHLLPCEVDHNGASQHAEHFLVSTPETDGSSSEEFVGACACACACLLLSMYA